MRFIKPLIVIGLFAMTNVASAADFAIHTPDLKEGKFGIANLLSEPYGFGCAGSNVSPRLTWENPPEGTKSYVLTIYDRDAPNGLGWVHWVVANIPAESREIVMGAGTNSADLPSSALQTRTDFGVPGYGGPCPPAGETHRYEITLTALKVDALQGVTADATPALVGFFAKANALGEAKLVITQGR
ncbi:YbhB/YbcL family Raf kinase inhibitor-like protein [Xanthomonas euvesicatoria]|uniref:YbhB/YbcL family Raf kinase inhibitor-like protein n=1 Tax=Xanthomonas euvesicatoria TaxID=456327 RepID=UPI0030C7A1D6